MQIIQTDIGYPCAQCGEQLIVFGNDVGHNITCEKCNKVHEVLAIEIRPGWSEIVIRPI